MGLLSTDTKLRLIPKPVKRYTCSDIYNCCDCGGENCGCGYCFSCHACENCLSDDETLECEIILVDFIL